MHEFFKKNDDLDKENYRPDSVVFDMSKVLEKMRSCEINCHTY